jgi:hypothetical protein
MIRGCIHNGRVEAQEPIPPEWERQTVHILALTPDDEPFPDLEMRLAALHALGPMEFEPGERETIAKALADLDALNKAAMEAMARGKP